MHNWILLLLLGFSFPLWVMVGAARLVAEKYSDREKVAGSRAAELPSLSAADVAVLIPARNEETGIAAAIVSVMRQVPGENIHVIADGCTDDTAEVAREYGVVTGQVLGGVAA